MLVTVVPAIADLTAPTQTEIAAGVDISCYLTSDGYAPSLEEQVIADERLCSTQTYEQRGRSARTLMLTYIDNTNAPNELTDNEAKVTLVPGAKQFIVTRRGLPYDDAVAADQKVSVFPITSGEYNELTPEANSVLKISQKQFISGKSHISVAVASGV